MEQQQTGKRGIALPITLVLLVFSMIGNVFLYSQFLQHKQNNKFETGQKIYAMVMESRQYFELLLPEVDALLLNEQLEARMDAKFRAGSVSQAGQVLVDLTAEAKRITGRSDSFNVERTQAYVTEVENFMRSVGNHLGALTKEERAYLATLKNSFEQMAAILENFNMNISDNRNAVIRLSSGLDWSDLVAELQPVLEHTAKLTAS